MSGFEKTSGDCISHKLGERNQFVSFLNTSHVVLLTISFAHSPPLSLQEFNFLSMNKS